MRKTNCLNLKFNQLYLYNSERLENNEEMKSENTGDYYLESPNKFFRGVFTTNGMFRVQVKQTQKKFKYFFLNLFI